MLNSVPLSTEDLEFKNPIEWEEKREGFILENFWLTWKRAVFSPKDFFENLKRGGSFVRPLLYACSMELLTAVFSSLIWGGIFFGFLFGGAGHWGVLGADFRIFSLFFGFFLLVAALFISSLVYYGTIWFLGARAPFRPLFRVYAYSESAVIFRLIPVIGIGVAEIVRVVLLFFGLRTVYRFSPARALVGALLPGLLLMGGVALTGFSFFQLMKI